MSPQDDMPTPESEAETPPPFIIESARSSRSKCRICRRKIEKGTLRLGVLVEGYYGPGHVWNHLTCAARRNPEQVEEAYALEAWKEAKEPVEDVPPLEKLLALKEESERRRAEKKPLPYAEVDPSGRAKCKQCGEPMEKGGLRVALGRDVVFGRQTRTAEIKVHSQCVKAALEAPDNATDPDTLADDLRAHSDLESEQIDQVLAAIG